MTIIISGLNINQDKDHNSYSLITNFKERTAGDNITLEFAFQGSSNVFLYCSNSYGSIILRPKLGKTLLFEIPKSISKKSGILNWQLHSDANLMSGQLYIRPKSKIETLETYIGPPSIEAGGTDYTMLVIVPTDNLDNPLADSTKVIIKHQFLETHKHDIIYTEHGFGYKKLYAYKENGRMLISSECLGLNSKEYDVNVMPAIPTNFKILADRIHSYADGNQITTFKTSIIRDRFDNIVSDGTFVSFYITNKTGHKSVTSGTTIDGIATAKMIHPDHEEQWTVKAYIEGIANSEPITLNYEQAVLDLNISFSENNRLITVGPLQSFMKQQVPNGLNIQLKIYKDNALVHQLIEQSADGFGQFKLYADRYPKGTYTVEIKTAGLTKSFADIKL